LVDFVLAPTRYLICSFTCIPIYLSTYLAIPTTHA